MKIRFKHQQFQADAAMAVCSVFAGQPYTQLSYMIDKGTSMCNMPQEDLFPVDDKKTVNAPMTGFRNHPITLDHTKILDNLQKIQRSHQIEQSTALAGFYNLTVEMETGVGKTYTYIKTMYELNKHYGWAKFIIVVPSIAIREGVFASLKSTQEHFVEEYNKKIKFFIYNSIRLNEIEQFANDGSINVMIINAQAFNATGKDSRRIYMALDSFQSRRPIDVIAATNPILIIDEPQSVEGEKTKLKLKEFNPLITLRYSATPKERYNLVYRLDAMEAYNKKLVKKIAVKSVSISGSTGTSGYVFLQGINLAKDQSPTATIEFDYRGRKGIMKTTRILSQGANLYDLSGGLDIYKDGYIINNIDGRDGSVSFLNDQKIFSGEIIGEVNEDMIRRLQIRATILSHIERERELFSQGIKVLSLFFIDEVAKYKKYDELNNELNGTYADIFEEEYNNIICSLQLRFGEEAYSKHLDNITGRQTHAGYFSIDKRSKKIVDSTETKKDGGSRDTDAYDLIMKDKERLLSFDEPVRFIFSHSALREGWDNPNVFQICTLKISAKEDKKRQEIGRGLRLCVNQNGERMDSSKLADTVHETNVLTVIANESYEDFTKALQTEIAEVVANRPQAVTEDLFKNIEITDNNGKTLCTNNELARKVYRHFIERRYIDLYDALTEEYYEAKKSNNLFLPDELTGFDQAIISVLDQIYDPKDFKIENANASRVTLELDQEKFKKKEFQELWRRINSKSVYTVKFKTDELISNSIYAINNNLFVTKIFAVIEEGEMDKISTKESLESGNAFNSATKKREQIKTGSYSIRYDLIGKIVEGTGLTRVSIMRILTGINKDKFAQFNSNPEDFILKVSNLINEQKATAIIEHITYNRLDCRYTEIIFTAPTLKSVPIKNIIESPKSLYSHLIYDSNTEKDVGKALESNSEVSVYTKLPKGFYINTPVGKYNPDFAIAFDANSEVKHIYFVAETKGDLKTLQLKGIELAKIKCAQKHFAAISTDTVKFDVIVDYNSLLAKVMD